MGRPVFLIGFMGCGKSTTGKKLAKNIGYAFFDTDTEIEKMTGKSIPEIFEQEGEAAFRMIEHSVIESLSQRKNAIVATGGGTPCFYNNIQIMRDAGITVYLRMSAESLAKRLQQSKTVRPLLLRLSPAQLLPAIEEQLEKRKPFYEQASLKIKGENLDIESLIKAVRAELFR